MACVMSGGHRYADADLLVAVDTQKKVCEYSNKCVKCGKCAKICSESEYHALSLDKECICLDKQSCIGCSLCSHVCPKEALKMCSPNS
jgi:Pyruvate/2-oxoacid:ferredoxin oxidoreductase delta subunit